MKITKTQAKFIRDLRVNKDYTWRAVARDFSQKYTKPKINSGNQIDGAELCDAAARVFNEDPSKEPWN